MKILKWICLTMLALSFAIKAESQSMTITNTYTVQRQVQVVQTIGANFINVVTSMGPAYTNQPAWISPWVDSQIYTNGLTTNNVKNIYVMWGGHGQVYNGKGIYQGIEPEWNGIYTCTLANAKTHILPGELMHVLIVVNDNTQVYTNVIANSNIVYNASGMLYKVIELPTNTPTGY